MQILRALRFLLGAVLLSCGSSVLLGQYPGPADNSVNSGFSWTMPQAEGSLSKKSLSQVDGSDNSNEPDSRDETASLPYGGGASGTVSVAELRHPLSGKARALIQKAQMALIAGNVDDCLQELDAAVKERSAIPYIPGVRGEAYLFSGRVPEAIAELRLAVEQLPVSANYSNLGFAYILNGDIDEGEQNLERALELKDVLQTRYLLGLVLLDLKPRNAEACDQLDRAQNLIPEARVALAVCYERGGSEAAAARQVRDFLGPARESEFDEWKKWVDTVATEARPSGRFGLHPRGIEQPALDSAASLHEVSRDQ